MPLRTSWAQVERGDALFVADGAFALVRLTGRSGGHLI